MSRSFRHTPITPVCIGRDRAKKHSRLKQIKTKWERNWLEKEDFSTQQKAFYKKFCHSWRWDPNDGKMWHDCELGRYLMRDCALKFREGYKYNKK